MDNTTQGDNLDPTQRGRTGTGYDPAYVAQPWDRALEITTAEPVRGQAPDSGLEDCVPWTVLNQHPSSKDRISTQPGAVATAGAWPIGGAAIHGETGGMDDGPGASKPSVPGFEDMGY